MRAQTTRMEDLLVRTKCGIHTFDCNGPREQFAPPPWWGAGDPFAFATSAWGRRGRRGSETEARAACIVVCRRDTGAR